MWNLLDQEDYVAETGIDLDDAPRRESTGSDGTDEYLAPVVQLFGDAEQATPMWQELALCAQTDPEAFFPEKGGSTRDAKKVCQGCEVKAECLEFALRNDERFGIWGGLSERERRKLKRRAS